MVNADVSWKIGSYSNTSTNDPIFEDEQMKPLRPSTVIIYLNRSITGTHYRLTKTVHRIHQFLFYRRIQIQSAASKLLVIVLLRRLFKSAVDSGSALLHGVEQQQTGHK